MVKEDQKPTVQKALGNGATTVQFEEERKESKANVGAQVIQGNPRPIN